MQVVFSLPTPKLWTAETPYLYTGYSGIRFVITWCKEAALQATNTGYYFLRTAIAGLVWEIGVTYRLPSQGNHIQQSHLHIQIRQSRLIYASNTDNRNTDILLNFRDIFNIKARTVRIGSHHIPSSAAGGNMNIVNPRLFGKFCVYQ